MDAEYRIESVGNQFIVVDPWGENVGRFVTEEAAKRNIEHCKKKDAMWRSARILVGNGIKAQMQLHEIDRDTARYWVLSAIESSE